MNALAFALAALAQPMPPPLVRLGPIVETGPRWSGEPDLCINTVTATDGEGAATIAHFFRIIGNGAAPAEITPAFVAEQERRCASAGPIETPDRRGPHFFEVMNTADVRDGLIAVRILRQALREAGAGTYADIECLAEPPPGPGDTRCSDPRRQLAGLDLDSLDMVEIARGDDGATYTVEARFDLQSPRGWTLTIAATVPAASGPAAAVRLGRARLEQLPTFDVIETPPPPED